MAKQIFRIQQGSSGDGYLFCSHRVFAINVPIHLAA